MENQRYLSWWKVPVNVQPLSHRIIHKKEPIPRRTSDDGSQTPLLFNAMSNDNAVLKGIEGVEVSIVDAEAGSARARNEERRREPWWSYIWDYEPDRPHDERKFVKTLDLHLLTILCLGYFIKTLDQTNIANAYVSGMKEDLRMNGNQINMIDIAWTMGYIIGQIPSQLILTRVRPSIWIPSCELVWTVLTFALAGASTSNHVLIIRFFVGLVESVFYPAAHFLIGSWYKPSELGKRACLFHASSALAGMCSGYLQAGIFKGLNGIGGKAGWQWLFIIDALISFPVCITGFFYIPDLPENTRAFYLSAKDAECAKTRMDTIGRAPRRKLSWSILKRVFSRWHVYALTGLYINFLVLFPSSSVNPLALWLKDNGWPVVMINIIPTGQSAVQFVSTISFAILSDYLRKRGLIMAVAACFGLFSTLLLAIWNIPVGLKWFAYFSGKALVAFGPLSFTWANEICSADAEERAIVLGLMNSVAYSFSAWLPLLAYPAKDAPRFRSGFIFSTCASAVLIGLIKLVSLLQRWEIGNLRRIQGYRMAGEADLVEENEI